ncbi:MAG: HAMP domain-containing sensor histidine kinase, partial [Janthinobacterium lividum]
DPSRVLTTGGEVDGQRFTVIVGQSLEPVENSFETTLVILAVGVPLVLLVVAAATFLFVGHALTPVGAIRRAVENITGSDLTERVPVPPGRDEVARLAGTMNAMLERLDTAARVQRQFVADASHELRSPIATLQAGADIARLMSDSTGTEELVELVSGEARRLERLVADLLLLARSDDRGPRAPEAAEELDLDDLVEAEVSRLRASTRLRVVVRLSPTRVVGNAHDLSRLLRNLTDNAVSHAQQKVEIELRREGGDAVLEVANDGDPIPVEDRERVFDRFVRLDESRTRDAGGSGLGLAIVREISTAHHGRVQVVDTGCHEARFRLVLPITLLPDAE